MSLKKKIWKVVKYILITFACLLVIILVAIYSLQFPAVQNFVKDKLVTYLEDKIKTKVSLDRVYVHFPNKIEIENLFLQGQDVDTLLYVNQLNVGLNLPKLLNNTAQFTSIDLDGLNANVIKRADDTFNFDYIIDAFATKEEDTDDSKPFVIDLDKIQLQNVNVAYKDVNSKNDIALKLTNLKTIVTTFNLETNDYAVNYINADGLKLTFNQGLLQEVAENVEETVDSLSQKNPLKVDVKSLNLTNFDVLYDDENSATRAKIVFKELSSKIDQLDLPNSNFNLKNLNFKDAFVDILLTPDSKAAQAVASTTENDSVASTANPLKVVLQKTDLDNVNVVYNNGKGENTTKSFNANHLNIAQLKGKVRSLELVGTNVTGEVKDLSFIEKSGFVLEELSTKFKYAETETLLENLTFKTPNTFLQRSLKLQYASIDDLSNNLGNVAIEANLPQNKIGFKDILWLAPNLKNTVPFNKYPNAVLNLTANVKGIVNDLLVQEFKLSGLGNLNVNAAGTIKNALDTDNLWVNLKVNDLTANKQLITALAPKNSIPNTIEIPENLSVSGKLKGSLNDIYADLGMQTSFGNAKITGTFNQKVKNAERYDLKATLANFNVGKLLKNKDLGSVTANAEIKGTGFNFEKNNATVNAFVTEAGFKGYTYRSVSVKGGLTNGNYNVTLNSDDENAKLNIVASGVYNADAPTLKTEGTVYKVDLNKLGFYATPMALAGKLNADFSSLNPDALNGELLLQDFVLSDGEEIYPVSEVSLKAISNDTINSIDLRSQIVDASITGKYKLTEISTSLLNTVNQYYQFQKQSTEPLAIAPSQYFDFRGKIKNDDLIRKFVPELKSFQTINLYGAYNADTRKITVYGSVPQLEYGAYKLNDIKLSAGNDEESLNYAVTLNELDSEQFRLANIVLDGFVKNDVIDYNLMVKNEKDEEQYKIAGNVATANELVDVSLKQDGLVLNYDTWAIAADNKLTIHPTGIVAQNLQLSNNNSSILVNSNGTEPTAPLNIKFQDFKIETLTEIVRKDSLLAEGTINGEAEIKDLMNDLRLTANLNVKDLKVFGNAIGTIDAEVANETASLYNADVKLSGFDNNMVLKGSYDTAASSFNADVDIQALQMTSIQGFSMNQLTDAKGHISGKLKVSGTTDKPSILGGLKFNNAGFGVTQLNTTFQNMNDEISFTNRGIEFNSFKINDTDGNALTIDGAVLTQTYQDFKFGLNVSARDFKVVNSTKTDNQILYGVMAINANIGVKGDMNLPKIDGTITVTDKTDFTFVLPQSSPALQEREGIIEFVDKDQLALEDTLKDPQDELDETLKGLDVNINIELNKDAKLSIIIDKANGDFIKLQGEAELTGGIDPSGKTTLVGRYEVNEGAYEMSVSLLKRRFVIQEGSSIVWTGEPTKANVDITAIYKTKAAPLDLVQQQLDDDEQANMFKQRIPFNTFLKMTGELLKPIISFDIEIDGNNPGVSSDVTSLVDSKLDQLRTEQSEMNKQVFALLLLNRFIGENPFQSSTGMSAESMARQSVSRMLSEQLNNLAADLVEGVELNFDLESSDDYTTGTRENRTDLNIGVSKSLLNDRLKVTVGSNFGLEGSERQNEQMTNIAGDIQIEYLLSRDGRYMLKAYRKNEYQVALQGQIIETGVGFVITLDYNQFSDLLRRRKRNREFKRTQRTLQNEQATTTTK